MSTTLTFCYGNGVCAPNTPVPAAAYASYFSFFYSFSGTGTYTQSAKVIETGAVAPPAVTTVLAIPAGCVPCVGIGLGGGLVVGSTTINSCTPPAGRTCTTTSGPAGTTLNVTASGLQSTPTAYNLKFASSTALDDGVLCRHATTISSAATTSSGGSVTANGTIPIGTWTGAGEVCFVDALHASDSSTPRTYTIVA